MLAGQQLDDLRLVFSPAGESLAVASPDGRIRTFDSGNGRLRVALGGPGAKASVASAISAQSASDKHTCITWLIPRKGKTGSNGLVAGTAAGDVIMYDTQRGDIRWRSTQVIEGGVFSIACSESDSGVNLLAVGPSGDVATLNSKGGNVISRLQVSKHPITCMALSPDFSHLLCGASGLALWDLTQNMRRQKYTGHPIPACAATFSPSGCFAVSCSPGEKQVAVWATHPDAKKSKKPHAALLALPMEDAAVQVDTCAVGSDRGSTGASGSGEASFHVAAVSDCGEAYVWLCKATSAEGGLEASLLARVRVGAGPTKGRGSGAEECILAAKLYAGTMGPALLVARGSSAKPEFQRLVIPASAPASETEAVVSLQPGGGGLLLGSNTPSNKPAGEPAAQLLTQQQQGQQQKRKYTKDDVTILGPGHLGPSVTLHTRMLGASGGKRGPVDLGQAPLEEDEVDDSPPDNLPPLSDMVTALEARLFGGEVGTSQRKGLAPRTLPSNVEALVGHVDALVGHLTQALRRHDQTLLERCFVTGKPSFVRKTVKSLVPMDAALLFIEAVDRVMSRPSQITVLAPWIQAIIHNHTGHLMSAPGVQPSLNALNQAIEGRSIIHHELLKVQGRLGLIFAQLVARGQATAAVTESLVNGTSAEPLFDDDEEEPVAEDPFAGNLLSDDSDFADEDEDEDSEGDDGAEEEESDGGFSDEEVE